MAGVGGVVRCVWFDSLALLVQLVFVLWCFGENTSAPEEGDQALSMSFLEPDDLALPACLHARATRRADIDGLCIM